MTATAAAADRAASLAWLQLLASPTSSVVPLTTLRRPFIRHGACDPLIGLEDNGGQASEQAPSLAVPCASLDSTTLAALAAGLCLPGGIPLLQPPSADSPLLASSLAMAMSALLHAPLAPEELHVSPYRTVLTYGPFHERAKNILMAYFYPPWLVDMPVGIKTSPTGVPLEVAGMVTSVSLTEPFTIRVPYKVRTRGLGGTLSAAATSREGGRLPADLVGLFPASDGYGWSDKPTPTQASSSLSSSALPPDSTAVNVGGDGESSSSSGVVTEAEDEGLPASELHAAAELLFSGALRSATGSVASNSAHRSAFARQMSLRAGGVTGGHAHLESLALNGPLNASLADGLEMATATSEWGGCVCWWCDPLFPHSLSSPNS